MPKIVRISLLLLVATLGGGLWWWATRTVPAERVLQMTVVSPDGAIEARVYSNFSSGALAVDSSVEEAVELSKPGQKSAPSSRNLLAATRLTHRNPAAPACPVFPGFHLYDPSRRQIPAKLRSFIEFWKVDHPG